MIISSIWPSRVFTRFVEVYFLWGRIFTYWGERKKKTIKTTITEESYFQMEALSDILQQNSTKKK